MLLLTIEPETDDDADPRKYVQIARVLRHRMRKGTLRPGDALSISHLTGEFQCAPDTARKSLRLLDGDGLLTRHPSLGWHVSGRPPTHRPRNHP
jgi:DNA-binding GntR family transcriptional regulator